MKSTLLTSSGLLLVIALAGCHSGVKLSPGTAAGGAATAGTQTNPDAGAQVATDPLNDPNSPLARRSVNVGFDDYTVDPKYQPLLTQHAQYLKSHPQRHVLIQGNTDERGSSEYNLALGEKRSEAVMQDLALLGVSNSQMEAVSLGKEKPLATGHDETAWAQNRRADLAYQQ